MTHEREPAPLPAEAREWLEHYVATRAMPRASFVRVGRAIGRERRPARTPWIVAAVLVAAVVVLFVASRLLVGQHVVADASDPHALSPDRADANDVELATTRMLPPAELPPTRATTTPPPPPPPPVDHTSRPATPVPPPATPATPSTLAAERELLQTAWDALAAADAARTKQILQQHREQFPTGQLVDVREAIGSIARCTAAPPTNRAAILATFERAYADSIVLGRVRDACSIAGKNRQD